MRNDGDDDREEAHVGESVRGRRRTGAVSSSSSSSFSSSRSMEGHEVLSYTLAKLMRSGSKTGPKKEQQHRRQDSTCSSSASLATTLVTSSEDQWVDVETDTDAYADADDPVAGATAFAR